MVNRLTAWLIDQSVFNRTNELFCFSEGKQLAIDNGSKYVEVSCTISHNVNLLLAGIAALINPSISKSNKSGMYRTVFRGFCSGFCLLSIQVELFCFRFESFKPKERRSKFKIQNCLFKTNNRHLRLKSIPGTLLINRQTVKLPRMFAVFWLPISRPKESKHLVWLVFG